MAARETKLNDFQSRKQLRSQN